MIAPMSTQFLDQLTATLGTSAVKSGADIALEHMSDWSKIEPVRPLALVFPSNTDDVSAVLRLCHQHRIPVVPQGGLTGLAGGARPVAGGIAMAMSRMKTIGPIKLEAMHVQVQAGATLQALQEAAEAAGTVFGVDLGARGSCQVGGNLATNAGGNGVIQAGMMREHMLGLEVVLADGTVLNMLRPMLKNNTGYDLKQCFVGSEGTLGVITQALLKVLPKAKARLTVLLALPDFDSALKTLHQLRAELPGGVAAFELMWQEFYQLAVDWKVVTPAFDEAYPLYALIDVCGHDQAATMEQLENALGTLMEDGTVVNTVLAQNTAQAQALWKAREIPAEFYTHWGLCVNFDVSLPLTKIGAYAEAVMAALSARWPNQRTVRFGHLGDGNLHLSTRVSSIDAPAEEVEHLVDDIVYGLLQKASGSISAEHGIGLKKKPYLSYCRSEAEINAMRAIKLALDPLNLLNPGKIFDLVPTPPAAAT